MRWNILRSIPHKNDMIVASLLIIIVTVASAKDENASSSGHNDDATTGESDVAVVGRVSGYEVAQTLDFATTNSTVAAMSNGHQNGMLLMTMLLDNKSYIESDSRPALPIFDFNPEDIQDLDGNDFYSVDGDLKINSTSDESTDLGSSTTQPPSITTASIDDKDNLWTLPENPLTMPLVMADDVVRPPGDYSGGADGSSSAGTGYDVTAGPGEGNIYKVKLKRRMEANKRDRHQSISSQMNILGNGNEVTTIKQFQTLTTMFDHWQWDAVSIAAHVSKQCGADMKAYLNSLSRGQLWALKVADSSGRYRGQFIFGNVFWMGSKAFCQDVNYHNLNGTSSINMHFMSTIFKLDLYSLVNKTKLIQVGQCLPKSCPITDVQNILMLDPSYVSFNLLEVDNISMDMKSKGTIALVASRNVPGPYSLWTDKRFQILGLISVVVVIIVIIATIVESKLDSDEAKLSNNHNNNVMQMKSFEATKNGNNGNSNHGHGDTQITVISSECSMKGYKDGLEITKDTEITTGRKCPSEQNMFVRFLLCFSLISNGKAIMCLTTPARDSLTSIHGIRLFSLLWTIMVHTYLQLFAIGENRYGRKIAERSFGYQMIGNASFAVDTFFFLSGLLVSLLFLRKGERASRQKSIFTFMGKSSVKASLLIIYRYLRLTPVYLVAIVANELSLKYTYNQSVFSPSIYDHVTCHHYWWRNILYINNWYPFQELCMIWSWYLANDMQFYLMAVFLLILSTRFRKTSVVIVCLILFSSTVASAIISLKYNYMYKVADPFEAFDFLYDKPWLRVGPYIMGMAGGFILSKWKKPPKVSRLANLSLWLCSIIVQFLLVFGTWDGILTIPKTAIYVSVGHAAWGLSLIWMVISCYWGLAQPVNKVLSYRAFLPLSRLTYCTYLLHPMIMVITSFRMEAPVHLQHVLILTAFLGNAIIAFIVALIVSLLFEAPVIRVLKLLFRK